MNAGSRTSFLQRTQDAAAAVYPGAPVIDGQARQAAVTSSTREAEGADGGTKLLDAITITVAKTELPGEPPLGSIITYNSLQWAVYEVGGIDAPSWLIKAARNPR